MPADYEAIKRSLANKYRSEKLRKKHAAMIASALRKKEGRPQINWAEEKKKEGG